MKLDRSYRPNSNETGQADRQFGQGDRSDQSARTTNKNKEKELIKKNGGFYKKTGDNLNEMKALLIEKMSIPGPRIRSPLDDT